MPVTDAVLLSRRVPGQHDRDRRPGLVALDRHGAAQMPRALLELLDAVLAALRMSVVGDREASVAVRAVGDGDRDAARLALGRTVQRNPDQLVEGHLRALGECFRGAN